MTPCLLCGSPNPKPLYQPLGTKRGITVYLCKCGLLQSQPIGVKGDGIPSTSADASYGNLRQGKISRAQPNLDFLRRNVLRFRPGKVLDVGASRGAFVSSVLETWPDIEGVVAIEPYPELLPDEVTGHYKVEVVGLPIEEVSHFKVSFDLAYLSHTLEHLDTPPDTLKKLRVALSPNGWLLVEVPNIRGLMGILDIVEELYLDKHVTHFSLSTLRKMLGVAGFRPLHFQADQENVTVLAQLGKVIPIKDDYEAASIRPMLQAYASDLVRNRELLKGRVIRLNHTIRREGRPALISGGGRILSALVEAGLDVLLFDGIVDPWLPLDEVYGLPVLSKPSMIGYVKPKTVLVCSRSSGDAMAAEAVGWMPGVQVIRWWE